MNVTKNQHYVSQGILKHFADDKKKTYEMYIGKKIISKKSIVSTMSQNYIYEHPQIQTNTLEHMFSYAEGMMIPTLDRFNVLSDETVREINNVIYQNSYVKCVGKYEDELIRVKDIEMGEYSPTECIMKYEDGSIKDYVTKKEVFLYDEDKDMCKNSINYMMDYEKKIKGKMQRNDLCICDSGKKYKKCCMKKYEIVQRIMHDIKNPKAVAYSIPGVKVSEMAIEVFSGQEKDLKNSKNKELIKQMEEMIQRRREEE